jgi:NitT/TauT family transport system ATP-binding protein
MLIKPGAPIKEPLNSSESNGRGVGGAAVELARLGHSFGELRALDRVDLSVPPGGVLGIVGPSGCGKSTLLEIVAGLREPTDGEASVAGAWAADDRLARCALMPQRDLLLPWLPAIDNASLALRLAGHSRGEARRRVEPAFRRLGLDGFELSRPGELSGGMRQRVAFLRTLSAGKPVLLLDEPFASLDAITRGEMQQWLASALADDRHTVLLVTHDVEEALYLSDRVAVMTPRPGRIAVELEVPTPRAPDRPATVTSPEFVQLRERALRALAGSGE